jgi:hypothetical protein
MNIIFQIQDFQLGYLYFLDTKQNIIIDGVFSKIIYSNQYLTLNSIFLYLPIEIQTIDKIMNKNVIKFYPSAPQNIQLVQELSKIEYKIIEYYKHVNHIQKKTVCLLTKQLYSGNLKLYRDYNSYKLNCDKKPQYIVKISGIWENEDEVGITYKIMEAFSL